MKLMLLFILILSSIMVISSSNMFMIWMSLELNLFSFIPILMEKMKASEVEASINYFLSQSLGSIILLMSSTMLLSSYFFKTYNSMLILISLLLKMGAAPCQFWYPTTMQMSSWMNCLILSTWQKMAPLFVMLYIVAPSMSKTIMALISSLNALVGGIMGLNQSSLKKIMSYSSITHTGWMLSGTIINTPCLSITYFIFYSMMIFPLFILFSYMNINKTHELWNKQNTPTLTKIFIFIMFLSIGGFPPLMGFFPKLLIINMLLRFSSMVTILLIIGSLLNLFFYLNISLNMMVNLQSKKLLTCSKHMKMNMIYIMTLNMLMLSVSII